MSACFHHNNNHPRHDCENKVHCKPDEIIFVVHDKVSLSFSDIGHRVSFFTAPALDLMSQNVKNSGVEVNIETEAFDDKPVTNRTNVC